MTIYKAFLSAMILLTSTTIHAGTDPAAAGASEVRDSVLLAMAQWTSHPTDVPVFSCTAAATPVDCCSGAGTGSCSPCGTLTNDACTGAGAPNPCCTGVDAGVCGHCCTGLATNSQCEEFSKTFIKPSVGTFNGGGWAYRVEVFCIEDGDWVCNPQVHPSAGGMTPARTLPGQGVVDDDVATWLSILAALQIP